LSALPIALAVIGGLIGGICGGLGVAVIVLFCRKFENVRF